MELALPIVATGHVVAGKVVLENPLTAPDGAIVRVEVLSVPNEATAEATEPTSGTLLGERLKNFLSHPPLDLPPDAAENHDRYLYGGEDQ
jgi:hypothetical protein